jgi:predicted RND superfamily exporter protein
VGTRELKVQDSWIDGFAPGSPFRQATDRITSHLHGTHLLVAHLGFEGASEEPLLDPGRLRKIGAFEAYARAQPGVGGVLGTHSHLITVSYLWLAQKEEARAIPEEPRRVRQLVKRFDQGRGKRRRQEVLDDAFERTTVTLFLTHANYRDTARLMENLELWARENLAPLGGRLDFAGDVAVSQAMIPAIVRTQVSSLLLALVGAGLTLCLVYRSLRWGLLALAPAALAVLWVFGAMGWLGIPLGVATSMFCAITLGIGVDYAIHFLERYREAADAHLPHPARQALRQAGPAIVADTAAIALGFGLLTVSQVPANARLGLLVALALGAVCLLTLAGLGVALELAEERS